MAIAALHSASTGLSALSTDLDVIAHNLANANTDGFKGSRTNFQDLLYLEKAQPGVENLLGQQRPTGLYVGLGTKVAGTQIDFTQGAPVPTERQLDVLIEGDGFLQVEVEDDLGDGIGYTRYGSFATNRDGELVLTTDSGRRLIPSIVVPEGVSQSGISITRDGVVWALEPGSVDPTELGTIELATFINPAGLRQIGENIYLPSAASGDPAVGEPRQGGRGSLVQGALEASNVDPVKELVKLIRTQRAFEMNSQSIQAADETLRNISQLRRF